MTLVFLHIDFICFIGPTSRHVLCEKEVRGRKRVEEKNFCLHGYKKRIKIKMKKGDKKKGMMLKKQSTNQVNMNE